MSEPTTNNADVQEEEKVLPKREDFIDSHLNADGIQRLYDMLGGHDGQAN